MVYAIIVLVIIGSAYLAYRITKKRRTFWRNVFYNVIFLLISAILILMTGIQETSLLIYSLILLFTLLGILARIFTPIVLNFTEKVLSRLFKQAYEKQSYEQRLDDGQKMFFCVLFFNTTKVLLYVALFMSMFNLI